MNNKHYLLAVVFVFACMQAYGKATLDNNQWQKVNDEWSGSITNVARWSLGHLPQAGERLYAWNRSADYTLSFPEEGFTSPANLRVAPADGHTLTLDGTNAKWVISGSDDETETSDENPFRVYGVSSVPIFNFTIPDDTALYTHAIAELEDFKFTVTGSASDPKIEFFGGSYDFRDPADSTWETTKKPLLLICNGNGDATGCPEAIFHDATVCAWDVGIQAGGRRGGKVLFDGGNYYFEALDFPNGSTSYANAYASRSDTTLTNGAYVSAGAVTLGHRANKDIRLHLFGEGTVFEARGAFASPNGAGRAYIDICDGAEMRFLAKAAFVSNGGTNVTRMAGGRIVSSGAGDLAIGMLNDPSKVATSFSVFVATNSTVSTPGALLLDHVADVTIAGDASVWSCGSFKMGSATAYAGTNPRLVLEGGRFTTTNDSDMATFGVGDLVIRGGTFTAGRYFNIGQNSSSLGTLTVEGGVFDNDFSAAKSFAPSPVGAVTYLGKSAATAKGVINVTGGEAKFCSVYAGWNGESEINVSGGRFACSSDLRLGNAAVGEHVLTQTGGEICLPFAVKDNIGANTAARVRIKLNGGTFSCKALQAGKASAARSGTGHVAFEADGGTITALDDSATVKYPLLSYFDEAIVRDGGLTIDTQGHAITLNQDISGTGTLTLTGGGTVTFTAGNVIGVPVKVVGDTKVVFNGVVPRGLTLGDAEGSAVLELTAGTPVVVDGDLAIGGALDLTVSGLQVGNTYDIFTASGAVDAGTAATWAVIDVKGVPQTAAYEAQVAENDGTTALQLVVREPKDIPVEVAAEAHETRTTNITWAVNDRFAATVGEGGELRLEGELRKGYLIKDGLGTLTLSNPDSYLFNGVLFKLGTIAFDYPADGAVADWKLIPSASESPVALNLVSDRSVTVNGFEGGTGAIDVSTAKSLEFGIPDRTSRTLTGHLTVTEGEAVFRGLSAAGTSSLTVSVPKGDDQAAVRVGRAGAGGSRCASAGLVVDNVVLTGAIRVGGDIADLDAPMNEAYLVVSNGAWYSGSGTLVDGANDNTKAWILVDGATLNGSWECRYNHAKTVPTVTARNGSKLYGFWSFRGDCDILVDASTMANNDKDAPMGFSYYANWDFTNNFTFVNGSVLNCQSLKCGWTGAYKYPAHFHLHFDDSEWKGMPDGFFGAVAPADESKNPYVEVRVKNTGLKLNVPADATYSWAYPLMDESADVAGGFVKQGEGTLKVLKKTNPDGTFTDDFSFAHTGPTVVEDGILDLNGNTWTRGTIGGGAGVVANGTLKSAKIALEIEDGAAKTLPNFAADCVFDGRVKVDLGGANLPVGATFEVANYAGTAPNVAKWKLIGNGETAGTFTAAGGKVMAEVTPKGGLLLIVR